ncbi:PREDICTED: maltase 1-like [Ceratosolen solmsi marchali]|uniref:alpha-glucosidase n=1 Tax=Ceratosolen solmsi marchali TaxID=326594 RepID=A0AAJ6YFI0_9HYME|nr:PREDICTED: maltase 1-like [Ceratosolen solmsi marchali]
MLSLRFYITFLFVICYVHAEIRNKGWWKNMVFYQIYPRSFMDSNCDGTGDLQGITNKLEHFVDIGIDAVWMSPINKSPMIDSGYDITDFRDIDPLFGTLHDFEKLIKKAKQLGIKVIIDFVPNHTSDQHEWFIKSVNGDKKYKDYYVWRKGRANNTEPPNNWISNFSGSAWTYNKKRDLWYLHQFDYRQPDLNFTNPNVHREMEEILKFWLNKGVDGFRIDAVSFLYEDDRFLDEPLTGLHGFTKNDREYLYTIYTKNDPRDFEIVANWRKVINNWVDACNEEEKIVMTEVYLNSYKFYNYGSHVPFNFELIMHVSSTSKPSELKHIIDKWIAAVPPGGVPNWVTSNHDRKRITMRYVKRPNLMLVLVMILPGVACVYYGEEIGMEDNYDITWDETEDPLACASNPEIYQTISRDPCRTPFHWDDTMNAGFSKARKTWLPVHKNYKILNLKNQKFEPESHFKLFKTLVALKKSSETLKSGSLITDTLNNDKVLVVSRQSSNESIVFIVNFSDDVSQNVNLNKYLPGAVRATVIISSVCSNIRWGSSIRVSSVQLPPTALLVLKGTINN